MSSNDSAELADWNKTDAIVNENMTLITTPSWDFNISFEFFIHGVLLCIIGILGLLGNVVSIIVLSRPQMKSSINTILIGLVSCDSLLIVTSILLFSFTVFRHIDQNAFFQGYYWQFYPYILPIVYPIGLMAQTGSAYLTLGVTLERYLVVCWPLKARSICTNGRAKLAVLGFATFAVIYNIPRFLEVTWERAYIVDFGENRTIFAATDLRKNSTYVSIYVTWMYLVINERLNIYMDNVFMYIIPFASLAVFNMLIFLEIRKANITRSMLSNQEKKEHNLAFMLLVVVIIFFTCNILALVVNILELFGIQNQQLIQVSNLLVTINSSVNILIYCLFGNKFKTVFMQIFCGQKPRVQTLRTGFQSRRPMNNFDSGYNSRTTVVERRRQQLLQDQQQTGFYRHPRENSKLELSSSSSKLEDGKYRNSLVTTALISSVPNGIGSGNGTAATSNSELELAEFSDSVVKAAACSKSNSRARINLS